MRARDWTLKVAAAAALPWLLATSVSAQPATPSLLTLDFLNAQNGLPQGALIQASNGNFYGTSTQAGGSVFQVTPTGTLTTLYTFTNSASGTVPQAALVQGSNGNLYGTTTLGGTYENGTVFSISTAGVFTALSSFAANNCQTFNSSLIQASDGNFYGATTGGANCAGTIYRVTTSGVQTTLYTFSGSDGALPEAALVQAANGTLYGTTVQGGANNAGTVFSVTTSGTLATLHSFSGTDGAWPQAALTLGTDGNFYGTTLAGGASNAGTVFRITPAGTLTTLYTFSGGASDGFAPNGLIQGSDGNFYGTTTGGGANANACPMLPSGACNGGNSVGTVFEITPAATFSTLYAFSIADGQNPSGALVQGSNGAFYGTTAAGGLNNVGTVFEFGPAIGVPPSGLTGSSNSSGAVTLTWNASVSGVTYNVYAANAFYWQNNDGFNPQPVATVTGTTATLSNLTPGTTYYFAVAWTNASGTSGLSNVVNVTTPGMVPPPLPVRYGHWGGGAMTPDLLVLLALLALARAWPAVRVIKMRRGVP
jgi:uncharacterized repeat protein (TIGR03803 family)